MSEVFFNDEFPNMAGGYGVSWIRVLDAVRALDADVFVPGHGLALAAQITAADAKGAPQDEAAIRDLIGAYQAAWNRHDAKGVAMLHTESAELVQRSGMYVKGRAEIEQFIAGLFKGIFADQPPAPGPKITSIRFLRPDVAIVHGTGDATARAFVRGAADPSVPTYIVTYVVTKEDGKWLIAAQNNNPVVVTASRQNQKP
jgi:uncharacterized protein (TIGR02246 family)